MWRRRVVEEGEREGQARLALAGGGRLRLLGAGRGQQWWWWARAATMPSRSSRGSLMGGLAQRRLALLGDMVMGCRDARALATAPAQLK